MQYIFTYGSEWITELCALDYEPALSTMVVLLQYVSKLFNVSTGHLKIEVKKQLY